MNELNIMWFYVIHLLNIPDNFRYILRFGDGSVWLILVPQCIHRNLPIHTRLSVSLEHWSTSHSVMPSISRWIHTIEIWLIQMCGAHFPLFVSVTPVKLFRTGLRDCLVSFFFWFLFFSIWSTFEGAVRVCMRVWQPSTVFVLHLIRAHNLFALSNQYYIT